MLKIAIDGPSGSGKGTLADGLAKEFNLKHIDTGAIFRTMGVAFYEMGINEPTEDDIKKHLTALKIEIKFDDNKQKMLLNGKDVTHMLRDEPISPLSSKISAFPLAREKYFQVIKELTNSYACVIDGRDITSVVLPNADVKFYLTADAKTRAERRYKENLEKNIDCTYDEILKSIEERDYRDSHRAVAPLMIVPDAIVVDNTNINIEETIQKCINIVNEVIKENK